MKLVESADQPLLVRFGLWHHAQVVPSLRWPAWNASVGEGAELLVARVAARVLDDRAPAGVAGRHLLHVGRDHDQAAGLVGHARPVNGRWSAVAQRIDPDSSARLVCVSGSVFVTLYEKPRPPVSITALSGIVTPVSVTV